MNILRNFLQLIKITESRQGTHSKRQMNLWTEAHNGHWRFHDVISYPAFVQTFKCFFSMTCKDQIPGLSRTQKFFFPGLSWKRSIQNIGCTRSKSAHTSKEAEMLIIFLIIGLTQEVALYYKILLMPICIATTQNRNQRNPEVLL